MAIFGHLAQGSSRSAALAADYKLALLAVAPESGTITSLVVDMENSSVDIQAMRAGVYAKDPAGAPTSLLGQSEVVLLAPGMSRSWVFFNQGLSVAIASGNSYWLTLQAGPTGGRAQVWRDTGAGTQAEATDIFSDGLSGSFGAAIGSSNSIAIYADYVPSTGTGSLSSGISRIVTGSAGWK
jgi:hypothetical protein